MKRVKRIAVAAAGLFIYCCAAAVAAPRAKAYETGAYTAECGADSVAAVAVLRKGSKGDEVKEVQRRLKRWGVLFGKRGRHIRRGNARGGDCVSEEERLDGGRRGG